MVVVTGEVCVLGWFFVCLLAPLCLHSVYLGTLTKIKYEDIQGVYKKGATLNISVTVRNFEKR